MNLNIDSEKLIELLENFYKLTHMRIVIFDADFNKVASYPNQNSKFCSFMKSFDGFFEKCRLCDKNALEMCKKHNQLYIYKCHAGLYEAVAPIKMNDVILGYIMLGQIAEKENKHVLKEQIFEYCKKFTDSEQLTNKCNSIVYKSKEQITAASKIMETSTCFLWINEMIKIDVDNVSYKITSYIYENLKSDIDVNSICSKFNLSRNKLYEISNKYYGMSIAKYIKTIRLKEAEKMLKTSNLAIYEVSNAVGITDSNYFTKLFKKQFGCLPGKYKNQ